MNPSPNSPESNLPAPEQVLPQLEAETLDIGNEQEPVGAERKAELRPEQDVKDDQVAAPVSPPPTTAPASDTTNTTVSNIPVIADDVDVIEKAWVDKAKQIIKETKDDPRAQEEAFEKLQIEYHKKRYGRDIKATR